MYFNSQFNYYFFFRFRFRIIVKMDFEKSKTGIKVREINVSLGGSVLKFNTSH